MFISCTENCAAWASAIWSWRFLKKAVKERVKILRGVFTSLGRQLAEVCLYRWYTRQNVSKIVVYEGFENYERALARGKGVLFLTAHLGAWELSAFAHSLYGYPLGRADAAAG